MLINISSLDSKHATQIKFKEYLKKIQSQVIFLGEKLIQEFDQHLKITDNSLLSEWIKLKTILNMQHVCVAYFRGGPFYKSDQYHFTNLSNQNDKNKFFNTNPYLKPISYYNHSTDILSHASCEYLISHKTKFPSAVLNQILFSRIALDSNAAIQLAHYLTLLDFFKLLFSCNEGTKLFDIIFRSKDDKGAFNRLRIGAMGSNWTGNWFDFSPIYFFMNRSNHPVEMVDLLQTPTNFIGSKFTIAGNKNYFIKHPEGHYQDLNVVFIGLNSESESLFLLASQLGQKYLYSYSQIISLLVKEYNKFPDYANKNHVNEFANEAAITGLRSNSKVDFDINKLKLLVNDTEKCVDQLKKYCEQTYENRVLSLGNTTFISNKKKFKSSSKLIHSIKDDHHKELLGLFKPHFNELKSYDDLELIKCPKKDTLEQDYLRKINSPLLIDEFTFIKIKKLLDGVFPSHNSSSLETTEFRHHFLKLLYKGQRTFLNEEESNSLLSMITQLKEIKAAGENRVPRNKSCQII